MISSVSALLALAMSAAPADTGRVVVPPALEAGLRAAVAAVWNVDPARVHIDWGRGLRLAGLPDSAVIALKGRGDRGWFVADLSGSRALTVRAGVTRSVWVARRTLETGSTLGPGDLVRDERVIWGPPVELVLESLVGRELKRGFPAGGEIDPAALAAPTAVRAGQTVWLTYTRGAVRLRVEAIAAGPARLGEIVRATDRDRGVALQGIMTCPGTAQLVDAGRNR